MRLLKFCLLNVTKKPLAFIINYLLILIFEKMKKLFGILALALLFSFTGMQEINAQNWEITVTWDDQCDDCVQVTGHEYWVCLKIWNKCTETEEDYQCQLKASGTSSHIFDVSNVCTIDEGQKCFDVSARVIKRCIVSQETICENTRTETKSCEEIYDSFTIYVPLN